MAAQATCSVQSDSGRRFTEIPSPFPERNRLPGAHTLIAVLDPQSLIDEVREDNNTTADEVYVYVNRLPGPTIPEPGSLPLVRRRCMLLRSGRGFARTAYIFEVDTSDRIRFSFKGYIGTGDP